MSALGDVIMTVPLLRTLQQAFPETRIHWIVSRPFQTVVEDLTDINLIVIDKPRGPLSMWRLYRQLREYHFDILLIPQASMRANIVASLIDAPRKIGFGDLHARDFQKWFVNETVPAKAEHLIDSFMRFATHIGAHELVLKWDLPLRPAETDWARDRLRDCRGIKLAVGLAASKPERNWPVERYRETLNILAKDWDITAVLIGGPGELERERAEAVKQGLEAPFVDLVGQSSMRQLAALLGQVDVLLAPDTGPLHIAQAMGTPVVGLYAVAPADKTGPYVEPQWTVCVFQEAVRTILNKPPEGVSWRQRVHDDRAMRLIQVPKVIERLTALFHDRKYTPRSRET